MYLTNSTSGCRRAKGGEEKRSRATLLVSHPTPTPPPPNPSTSTVCCPPWLLLLLATHARASWFSSSLFYSATPLTPSERLGYSIHSSFQHHTPMFSQSSFRPLNEDTPPTTKSTSSSRFATPEVSAHTSPIDEEDEFDLGDPHFNRSRASSTRSHHDSGRASPRTVLAGQHGSAGQAGTTFLKPEEVGSLLQRLSQSDGGDKSDQSVSCLPPSWL